MFFKFTFDLPKMWFSYFATQIVGAVILFLHHNRRYFITPFIACIIYPSWLAFTIVFYDPSHAEANVFILVILLTMILYQDRSKFLYAIVIYNIVICAGTNFYLQSNNGNVIIDINPLDNIVIFVIASIASVLIMILYQNEIKEISDHRKQLIHGLKRKNIELERFAYVTSHDLKEPVRTIGSFAGLLRKKMEKNGKGDDYKELILEIENSADHLSKLIVLY